MPLNIGKAQIRGWETGIKFSFFRERFYANIFSTWMKETDETAASATKGKRLIYSPDYKFDFIWGININNLSSSFNYRFVDKRYTTTENTKSLPDYHLLNGNLSYKIQFDKITVDTKIQVLNIFDKSIFLNDGFPMPGREYRFSLGLNY